ncbi:PhoH family protein [Pectinatus sottacetonis]|uniref:PhoH family protein n=1 Tax=Pectinatus sottacetonis TaxID=1002795 RepID=UPI0018C69D2E|nr:PhoH family protein [Pectinatus sottacetonis]
MRGFDERKIIFQNKQETVALLGEHDEFFRVLNDDFSCKIAGRGTEIIINGEENQVAAAAKVFEELLGLYRQGAQITIHEVKYAIKLVKKNEAEKLHSLFSDTLFVSAKGRTIRPKTLGQKVYIDTIRKSSITFGIGPAGTGKTYLAVVMAVMALRNHEVDRIILTRPAVEAGERLGYLPGDLQEKVDPYLRPLYDALQDILGAETYKKLMEKNIIETAPLAYMRGRTLERAFAILDEAQNTTGRQMKMFLTRLGFGSKMIVNGDLSQVDLPRGAVSGLAEAVNILHDIKGIGCVYFNDTDVIRHDVVARIIKAYDIYETAALTKTGKQIMENKYGNIN